jgi:hypothetical protein
MLRARQLTDGASGQSRHSHSPPQLPLYPYKQTSSEPVGTSHLCQKPTSGRGRYTAAQPDGKRDQQQACQRKPDNRISHVIVGQMHLKRPGFRDAARKHWSLQIDVERRNPIPAERLRHGEMIPGEPQPLRVLYVGPEQAGCHGKTEVAGQRDGLLVMSCAVANLTTHLD